MFLSYEIKRNIYWNGWEIFHDCRTFLIWKALSKKKFCRSSNSIWRIVHWKEEKRQGLNLSNIKLNRYYNFRFTAFNPTLASIFKIRKYSISMELEVVRITTESHLTHSKFKCDGNQNYQDKLRIDWGKERKTGLNLIKLNGTQHCFKFFDCLIIKSNII